MKCEKQKSSEMETQSFQGFPRYNRALSVKQHGRGSIFLTLKISAIKKCLYYSQFDVETPSKNYLDKHFLKSLQHLLPNFTSQVEAKKQERMLYTSHKVQSHRILFLTSTLCTEILSMGIVPSIIANKQTCFSIHIGQEILYIKQFNNYIRNVIYIQNILID